MNLRALTRGDAAVAGAAVLLFIASFLPYATTDTCSGSKCKSVSTSAWSMGLFPVLPSVFLLGLIGAGLVLLQRFQGEAVAGRKVLGLGLDQWGTALTVAALWSAVWSLVGGPDDIKVLGATTSFGHGFGAWLAVLALLVLGGAMAAGPLVPALGEPLLPEKPAAPPAPAPAPQAQQVYQPYPQQQTPPGGVPGPYGYQGEPAQAGYGHPQPQAAGYGFPADPHAQEATALLAPITDATPAPVPTPMPAPAAAAAPFQPFWFAVPAIRQVTQRDHPMGPPIGELVPGNWYLAVEERGSALVAQLPNGGHGLLADTSGIQRG